MPEYTVLTVVAVLGVLAAERFWWRSGVLRTRQFWIAMAIVGFFQCLVDGWLTKLSAPIVIYNPQHHSGIRFPVDIPIEDFGFGFAMVTMTIVAWQRLGRDDEAGAAGRDRQGPVGSAEQHEPGGPSLEPRTTERPR